MDYKIQCPVTTGQLFRPWTFAWNVRKVPRAKKMSGFLEHSKAMFSEWSCGTFHERSKEY